MVVIRAAGERTEGLCEELVQCQLPDSQIAVIHECPFTKAVHRTFEIGIESGHQWTLAIDADVLVSESAISKIVEHADKEKERLFELEGKIVDKMFGAARSGGLHLYRTDLLPEAMQLIDWSGTVHRPEYSVILKMRERGYDQVRIDAILGLHDFEQYYGDYFRKGYVHAQKNQRYDFLEHYWRRQSTTGTEFKIALLGFEEGSKDSGPAKTDIREFSDRISEILAKQDLQERRPILRGDRPLEVGNVIDGFVPAPEHEEWERRQKWQQYCKGIAGAPQKFLGGILNSIPFSVREAVKGALLPPKR